jgi:glucose-6-phosphate isomerase
MNAGVDFAARWPALEVSARRARVQNSLRLAPGPLGGPIGTLGPDTERAAAGLWRRDPSVWSSDAAVQQTIIERLGWLSAPALMADSLDRITAFAGSVRSDGISDVVLLGMGGSSLAPEVLRSVLGSAPGWPRLHVLDSTDPAAVRAVSPPPATTLYILASKSGTTIEPNALAAHYRAALEHSGVSRWAAHFVAITDEGTELAVRARTERYREVFINPSDIGGRYSALSFFGLVPSALMGQDVASLVGWSLAMLAACEPGFGEARVHPALGLGVAMAAGARAGRDKLTLVLPADLEPFGLWIEQLVAESTGKQGQGVVPISGEPLPHHDRYREARYSGDRVFVRMALDGHAAGDGRLERANLPVVDLSIPTPAALGAEFVRWEVATAVASSLLHINPFDEPNVKQAKDATSRLLSRYRTDGRLPAIAPDATRPGGATLTLSTAAKAALGGKSAERFLELVSAGDYVALLAYVGPDAALAQALQEVRIAIRAGTGGNATMFGYGPRYLHSTGQLHKGGPNSGVFVIVTTDPAPDVPIPDDTFPFGTLELAQALGDFQSLDEAARRALYVHVPQSGHVEIKRALMSLVDALGPADRPWRD